MPTQCSSILLLQYCNAGYDTHTLYLYIIWYICVNMYMYMYIHTHTLQTCKLYHTHIYTHKHTHTHIVRTNTHTHIVRTCVHTYYVYKHTLYVYMILENLLRGVDFLMRACVHLAPSMSAHLPLVCVHRTSTRTGTWLTDYMFWWQLFTKRDIIPSKKEGHTHTYVHTYTHTHTHIMPV